VCGHVGVLGTYVWLMGNAEKVHGGSEEASGSKANDSASGAPEAPEAKGAPGVEPGAAVGDVTAEADWGRLSSEHGDGFTHMISGAALTPTRADEEARPVLVMEVNTTGTIRAHVGCRACSTSSTSPPTGSTVPQA
jgi:hypothetical protein